MIDFGINLRRAQKSITQRLMIEHLLNTKDNITICIVRPDEVVNISKTTKEKTEENPKDCSAEVPSCLDCRFYATSLKQDIENPCWQCISERPRGIKHMFDPRPKVDDLPIEEECQCHTCEYTMECPNAYKVHGDCLGYSNMKKACKDCQNVNHLGTPSCRECLTSREDKPYFVKRE